MKRLMYVFILFAFSSALFAQTSLTIIGTMHNPTEKINDKTILETLKIFSPDVVLMELDNSIMDSTGKMLINAKSNEIIAALQYQKETSALLRPFDYKNRNKYYKENNTFANEDKFSRMLDSLSIANALDPASKTILLYSRKINRVLSTYDKADLMTINLTTTSALMELRQDIIYNDLLKIAENTPAMAGIKEFWKKNGEFWNFRNSEMAKNILKYINEFRGKKIALLVGYYHKYALVNLLKKEQFLNGFILKEFWEF